MNEFLVAIENHPWTTFWVFVMLVVIAEALSPTIRINNEKKNEKS